MEERIRVHAIIQGRVQGVFFRKETQQQAIARDVTGWARNRTDGSVETVFEGRRKDVEGLVRWCEQGPPAADVVRVEAVEQPYTGEFGAFLITY